MLFIEAQNGYIDPALSGVSRCADIARVCVDSAVNKNQWDPDYGCFSDVSGEPVVS